LTTASGSKTPGTIITFYSYKGGTGRSMALANVGWILAAAGKRVLMIDWDLEAPGLHRYFRPFLIDPDLTASDGIIDFVLQYATAAVKPASERTPDWLERTTDVSKYTLSIDYDFQGDGVLDLIPAGRQRDTYATRVSTFNWQNFYERLGGELFVSALRNSLRRDYDYVLIDSRTGVSDTAGICTVHFPDLLAVCFTYNNQSTEGASGVAQSVNRQRAIEAHDPKFRIVPLPMRIDPFESAKLDTRRAYAWSLFAPLLGWMSETERRGYWLAVEVPYVAAFAYEELLATFRDEPSDPKSVLAAFVRMTRYLTNGAVTSFQLLDEPSEREGVLAKFAATSDVIAAAVSTTSTETSGEAAIRRAERVYGNLTPAQQESARRFWLRLVRLTGDEEAGFLGRVRVLRSDLGDVDGEVIAAFINASVVIAGTEGPSSEPRYEAVDDALVDWARLRDWAGEQRDVLMWRQRVRPMIDDWLRFNRSSLFLMPEWLIESSSRFAKGVEDLNAVERDYINVSRRAVRKRRTQTIIAAAAIGVFIVAGIWYQQYRQRQEVVEANRAAVRRIVDAAASSTDSLEAALLLAELRNYSDPVVPDLMNTIQRLAQHVVPRTLIKTGSSTLAAVFSPSSRQILTITTDGKIVVWNAQTGQRVTVVQEIPSAEYGKSRLSSFMHIDSLAFPREDVVIFGLDDGSLQRWVFSSEGGVYPPTILPSATSDTSAARVSYAPKGDRLVDVSETHLAIRDPFSGEVLNSIRAGIGLFSSNAITADGMAAVVANGPRITLWNTRTGAEMASDDARQITSDVAVTTTPLRIVSASQTSIRVVPVAVRQSSVILIDALEGTTQLSVTNDMIGTGAQDGVGRLRSFADLSKATELRGHRGRITWIKFDADGKLFATCGVDGTVRIWPVAQPKTGLLQWKDVAPFFRGRTTACLTAEQRTQILGEKLNDATAKYRKCETLYGRTGLPSGGV